jgi:hypothetical protein
MAASEAIDTIAEISHCHQWWTSLIAIEMRKVGQKSASYYTYCRASAATIGSQPIGNDERSLLITPAVFQRNEEWRVLTVGSLTTSQA